MLELYHEMVHPEHLISADWFAESSVNASAESGKNDITDAVDALELLTLYWR